MVIVDSGYQERLFAKVTSALDLENVGVLLVNKIWKCFLDMTTHIQRPWLNSSRWVDVEYEERQEIKHKRYVEACPRTSPWNLLGAWEPSTPILKSLFSDCPHTQRHYVFFTLHFRVTRPLYPFPCTDYTPTLQLQCRYQNLKHSPMES